MSCPCPLLLDFFTRTTKQSCLIPFASPSVAHVHAHNSFVAFPRIFFLPFCIFFSSTLSNTITVLSFMAIAYSRSDGLNMVTCVNSGRMNTDRVICTRFYCRHVSQTYHKKLRKMEMLLNENKEKFAKLKRKQVQPPTHGTVQHTHALLLHAKSTFPFLIHIPQTSAADCTKHLQLSLLFSTPGCVQQILKKKAMDSGLAYNGVNFELEDLPSTSCVQ